ncbi:MAG: hypothetical protein L3J74_15710 [Bacteroidales bacterium]|nr:hypothetical protein [Bacteroidales bacterium]
MGKVIITIHGLRNKPPRLLLQEWFKTAIKEGFDKLGLNLRLPKFKLVYWADILYEKPLSPAEKNQESQYFIDEPYVPETESRIPSYFELRKSLAGIIKTLVYKIFLDKSYQLRYPVLAKSYIHNNFRDLEVYFAEDCEENPSPDCESRRRINQRLIKVLKRHRKDDIFLIAHSMGSIIAYDVLRFILTDIKIHTLVTMGAPLGAPFVVSRIAKYSESIDKSDDPLKTPETVIKNWYNFSDIRDYIALDYKLSDDFQANSLGVKVKDILVTNTYEINGVPNPHKSFGYLRTPEFINVLDEFIKSEPLYKKRIFKVKRGLSNLLDAVKRKKKND